jgi:hypothetical protein
VLALTDAIYSRFPKHIAEQFAFSYCLQKKAVVKSASEAIQHYWNLKEFRQPLRVFFEKNKEENIPDLVKLVKGIDAAAILYEKTKFLKLPLFRRVIDRVLGRNWTIKRHMEKI